MNRKMKFTGREAEILQLVADGFSTAEIAEVLFLSEDIIDGHCRKMIKKTGAKNIADLVMLTSKAGWLNEFPAALKKHYSATFDAKYASGELTVPHNAINRLLQNNFSTFRNLISPKDGMKTFVLIFIIMVFSLTLVGATLGNDRTVKPDKAAYISVQQLRTDMRSLLADHVLLTRNIMLCIVDGRPGIDSAVTEIVNNQVATSCLMKRYYGAEAGKEYARLLYSDITRAADVMIACRNGHTNVCEKAGKKWEESADRIVAFLTQTSPSWRMYGAKKIIADEMKYTVDEMVAIKNKDVNADKLACDKARTAALELADVLSETIILHFPERFRDVEMAPPSIGFK